MANEMFTTRTGRRIPIPTVTIPKDWMVPILRLQEDFIQRGEHLSTLGVILDVVDKGVRQVRNQWKNGDLSKNRRDFAKAVAPYMSNPAKYAVEIQQLAVKHGLTPGSQVDLSDVTDEDEVIDSEVSVNTAPEAEELSEEQLEAATAPEAV